MYGIDQIYALRGKTREILYFFGKIPGYNFRLIPSRKIPSRISRDWKFLILLEPGHDWRSWKFFPGGVIFQKTTRKFTRSLQNSRQNMCRDVKIDNKMWKKQVFFIGFIPFQTIFAILLHISIYWTQKLWSRNFFDKFRVCIEEIQARFEAGV